MENNKDVGLLHDEETESITGLAPSEHLSVADRGTAVEVGMPPGRSDKKKILKERALKLAHKDEQDQGGQQILELIEFVLGQEHYAIEVQHVREVYPLKDLTPVPCTPSFVAGIINVRGQVMSVTDLREMLPLRYCVWVNAI